MSDERPAMCRLRAGGPPAVVLGTMNFGQRTSERDAIEIIRRALDRGVAAFDSANVYCDGDSERILGKALGADRARVGVATKVGAWKREGLRPERVKAAIDESLERLGTDHVDVYYLHVPDHRTPIAETLAGMKEVIDSGKAKAWGVSNYASWQILEMIHLGRELGLPPPAIAQQLYNLLHRELEIEHFAFKIAHGLHLTVYNALAGGLLTGRHDTARHAPEKGSRLATNALYRRRYVSDAMFDRTAELGEVAAREGVSLVQLAYGFYASRPAVDSVLVGPATVPQLDAAIDGVATRLSTECIQALDLAHRAWTGTDTHYVR